MCLSKYSNLEHLREVAINLYSSEDHEHINGLCEKELAALINTFYQNEDSKITTTGEKRKSEVDASLSSDNKKIKVINQVMDNILSSLELLPNEVYEKILKNLGGEDKKNLRFTSKELYHKTSLMAPMFRNWCFEANKGTQPDYVLKTDKNFHVSALKDCVVEDPTYNLINNYAHRITSITIDDEGVLLNSLNYMSTGQFLNLTSLDLQDVTFDDESLLLLAPQLEKLRLVRMDFVQSTFLSVDNKDNKCFTKLKDLKLENTKIDVKMILAKCCNTLQYCELKRTQSFDRVKNLEQEMTALKILSIELDVDIYDSYKYNDDVCRMQESIRNLLSKCAGSLKSLRLFGDLEVHVSSLLQQNMKITSFEYDGSLRFEIEDIEDGMQIFLNKCPFLQDLSLTRYRCEINGLVLKDLIKLELIRCNEDCVESFLKQASQFSLKTLVLKDFCSQFQGEISATASSYSLSDVFENEYPKIPGLDTFKIDDYPSSSTLTDLVLKLFPSDAKIRTEVERQESVFRRVDQYF